VEIVLKPRHRNASRVEVTVDLPMRGDTAGSFTVSGSAVDRGARAGSGIDVLNVWAFPHPGSGAAPLFLGSTKPDGAGAFVFGVDGLGAGVYDLAVFPRSTVTGQFETPSVVRVRVR
jgi:hypothetical protein